MAGMTRQPKHTAERWLMLSLPEQLANIGSEFERAEHWADSKQEEYQKYASERTLELLDLTVGDPRWADRRSELVRLRELVASHLYGSKEFGDAGDALRRYFLQFALRTARLKNL